MCKADDNHSLYARLEILFYRCLSMRIHSLYLHTPLCGIFVSHSVNIAGQLIKYHFLNFDLFFPKMNQAIMVNTSAPIVIPAVRASGPLGLNRS